MSTDIKKYKTYIFTCTNCKWSGPGKDADQGDIFEAGFELNCPKCGERIPSFIEFQLVKNPKFKKKN